MTAVSAPDPSDRKSDPAARAAARRPRWRRLLLMAVLPVAVAVGGGYVWVTGGRYVSTDNAYVQQDKVTVSPDVAGRVVEVAVHENQTVSRGQLLFRIDEEPFRLALQQADAAVASARLKVDQLRAAHGEALANQRAAEETVDYQQREFQRQQDLLKTGVAARAKYDEVRHDLQSAQQALNSARQSVISARAALGGDPDIPTDRHPSVLEAIARRDQARRDLEHTVVRAPADGTISQTDRLLVGQYMPVGTPAVSLVESGVSWVEANFKETDLTHMKPGQTATIAIDAYPDRRLTARVESIGAGTGSEFSVLPAQNATGNWVKVVQRVPVRLRIEQSGDPSRSDAVALRTGLSADVEIDTHYTRPLPSPVRGALAAVGLERAEP
ncbi:HlyD family secretion protein [Azospirillum thermophilum]|uniref:HlyD family secretion protein n=1 Tax=Azospirillum thermophilum TaxID=2202148 RepID=A0A2S2CL81_9PROT|nr:HlyD family secretion protein [Azospirillum thermophilum]AWK85254.1 HlyD family secretion protein [Azospirillum thermophilum]